jgi:PPM family protein phosphatase
VAAGSIFLLPITNYQLPTTYDLRPIMKCPNCDSTVQAGDRFCEECGTPLAITPGAVTLVATRGCEKCGAELEDIDAEGFCSKCGFRPEIMNRECRECDRIEIAIQPNLAGVTDRGLRHLHNEDFLACAKVVGKNAYILVVCDGVSSSESPDLAAKIAADSVCDFLTAAIGKGDKPEEAIKTAFATALTSICAIHYTTGADTDPPSTTIVAAVAIDRAVTIGWLGDSRAYWISPHNSRQLTRDHSWINEVVSLGRMSEAEAKKLPQAHAITRWLGADAGENAQPFIMNFDIPGSGYLLLCTDGLWNYAPQPAQIAELVKPMLEAEAVTISRGLVEFARNRGGHDNITVAVLSL